MSRKTTVLRRQKFLKVLKTFFKKFSSGFQGQRPKDGTREDSDNPSLRSFFGEYRRKKRTKKTASGRRPHLFFWEILLRRPQIFRAHALGIFRR